LKLGENYPEQSLLLGEEGICVVRVEVDAEGFVRATQLVFSSGFDSLDAACLSGFAGGQFRPAKKNGKAVTTWINVPIAWNIPPSYKLSPAKTH